MNLENRITIFIPNDERISDNVKPKADQVPWGTVANPNNSSVEIWQRPETSVEPVRPQRPRAPREWGTSNPGGKPA